MNTLMLLGKIIKERRLALNMRMEDLARKANISRATLWSIEKGEGNCSIKVIDTIFDILGLSFDIKTLPEPDLKRERAPRINSKLDKKVNRFVIMCIEQYAHEKNISSKEAYELMFTNKVIDELISDYEDLHGMSTVYINEYISKLLGDIPQGNSDALSEEHLLAKSIIITKVTELISNRYSILLKEARDRFYKSNTINLLDDDETGLYAESPLYVFSLYEKEAGLEKIKIADLQPSQFYISRKKLDDIMAWFDPNDLSNFEPIPVKYLDNQYVITDGHTRIVAALLSGLKRLPLVWDEDDLDWDMYRECVKECKNRNINTPMDLLSTIISEEEYEKKWNKWCDVMQQSLIDSRNKKE